MISPKIAYLYFLVDADCPAFKVGVSANPQRRIAALPEKIDFGRSLQFSCDRSHAFRAEKAIHFLFSNHRFAKPVGDGYTEWFSMAAFQKILDFVLGNQDKFKWIDYGQIDSVKNVVPITIKGDLSLLERKLASALLFHAYPWLFSQDRHEIELRHLCGLVGYNSNDWAELKEALESLRESRARWGLLGKANSEDWNKLPLLQTLDVEAGSGICRYSYDPALLGKLCNPLVYATINLDIQKKLGSKYALALYENCVRFRDVGSTGWMALEVFRQLLGCDGQSHYDDFKQLNQKVIKPAVKEVNETSDIEVQPEYKRSSRKVSEIRMKIADKRNLPPLGASPSQLRPADEKARIDAMADAVAAREKEAKTKEVAMKTLKEIRAALGIPERKEPES